MTATDDVLGELEGARRGALRLLAELSPAPRALRVHAGDAHIEVEWADTPAAAPVVAAPAAAATEPSAATVATNGAANGAARHLLRAPTVGNVFLAPKPDADPFVAVGDPVSKGQQVAIMKILKLTIPVKADVDGTLVEVLRRDGEPLEHDEPVFAVDTSPAA